MSQILIGHGFWKLRENVKLPVYWREAQVSNHHVGVAGTSGAGKSNASLHEPIVGGVECLCVFRRKVG
ncbi:hypothetical protein BRM42_07085 [Xanthomonas oryzae pv. oryzae]|nr:hypothetical protein BRM42_07085 [Xanthomonas oryzae pv. oryzae]